MEITMQDIEQMPVVIKYVGETVKHGDWKCDEWAVTITVNKRGHTWRTSYFTGLGLRRKSKVDWMKPTPVTPKIADVMHALVMDAVAIDMSFADWCDNYGYNADSLTALEAYRQCCETGQTLRAWLGPNNVARIRALLQDY